MLTEQNILFMEEAIKASLLSNDPHCKVGAVLVKGSAVVARAWNEIDLSKFVHPKDERLLMNLIEDNPSLKNALCAHAEANLAKKRVHGGEIYITKTTCQNCAFLIAQMGVKRAFMPSPSIKSKWLKTQMKGLEILNKAGICVTYINVHGGEDGVPYLKNGGRFD